ncbi:hypothetical protein RIR_jg24812.t1 [Rhizophagus irregularis DAOM 181602=DAOM 197198]|uniref:Uncharacterized protein n=1 Tax=Rhizophagus irregularis (strain DAOM 181602 / DAOM 197198 / MUCL 43194) TaxID=747089 RepID=U9TWB7_RHIID|nr:hypothetical protein RIR_jg24812.t1 [Rhizophagus irregularis DAOM 181602=DAOM 197198]
MQMVNFGSKVFNKYLLYSIIIAFSELSLSSPLTLIIFTSSSPFSKLLLLVTIKSSDTIAKYLHGFGGRKFMKSLMFVQNAEYIFLNLVKKIHNRLKVNINDISNKIMDMYFVTGATANAAAHHIVIVAVFIQLLLLLIQAMDVVENLIYPFFTIIVYFV